MILTQNKCQEEGDVEVNAVAAQVVTVAAVDIAGTRSNLVGQEN